MDVQMPVMDGVEGAVSCIRAHEAAHALPPILMYLGAARPFPVLACTLTCGGHAVSG
jgi:CheY-like chemotaxis protein